jgi:hypothetical protein
MKRLKRSKKLLFKHERLYKFMRMLRTKGDLPSASILARDEKCTTKTVYRCLSILRKSFGYNIEWDSNFNFYRLVGHVPKAYL